MTDRELMQMALDALEAQFYTDGRTIKALRDRLAQPEPECIYPECETGIGCDGPCGEQPVDTVKQEPVLWRYRTVTFWDSKPRWRYLESLDGTEGLLGLEPLYTAPLSIEAAVKAERNRCLKVLSDLHNDSKNNHNYYAYAAMRINEVEA